MLFFAYSFAFSILALKVFAPAPPVTILFLGLVVVSIAIDFSDYTCILIIRQPLLPPKLDAIGNKPSVALLMTVCDDLVPEALAELGNQSYENVTVFLLDDSTLDTNKNAIDRRGFEVVRRNNRCGAKAGNLNYWLQKFGYSYNYFVVLDSDSILPPDFVERILHYAEHPASRRIAVFNSVPHCWNRARRFPRLLSLLTPFRNWCRLRLENVDATTLSSGHNNLLRTSAVLQAGGFSENLVAEDIALSLALLNCGYRSVLTDVPAWEAEPEHVFSFIRRQRRWASQTMQAANISWPHVPFSVRYRFFKLVWGYLGVIVYPVWFMLSAWGAHSTWTDAKSLLMFVLSYSGLQSGASVRAGFPLLLFLGSTAAVVPLLRAARVPIRDFALYLLFAWGLTFYSMQQVAVSCVRPLVGSDLGFEVTDKSVREVSLWDVVRCQPLLLVFLGIVALGLSRNIVSIVFAFPWFCLLFGCQLAVYWAHRDE